MVDLLVPVCVAVPVVFAGALLLIGRLVSRFVVDLSAIIATLVEIGLLITVLLSVRHGAVVHFLGGWRVSDGRGVGIVLVADAAGTSFALLAAVLGAVALLYGWRYFADIQAHYHALLLLFVAAMIGYSLAGDLFTMFVFFELMGAAAYALTGLKVEEPESVQGGFNFAVVNSIGAYVTLTGIALLYARTGRLGLAQIGMALDGKPADWLVIAGFVLVCTGWLVKSAAVPFHFWLADAHAVAPTPVCVLLSGIMAPLGVYGVARTYWAVFSGTLDHDSVRSAFLVFGVLTAVVGAVMCLQQRHIKRMLAYSTIAHTGIFLLALSTIDSANLGYFWLYLIAHAGAKGALFLLAGVLLSEHEDVDEISLYGKGSRALGVLFVAGALALAGLPPFGTALGKSALEENGPLWMAIVIAGVSALTAAAVLRTGLRVFFGLGARPHDEPENERTTGEHEEPEVRGRLSRAPMTMLTAIVVLLLLALGAGLLPQIGSLAGEAGAALGDHHGYLAAVSARPGATTPGTAPRWTASELLTGTLTTLLVIALAALALRASGVPRRPRWLHTIHSGHVGDYVAWLLFGVAALGAIVAW